MDAIQAEIAQGGRFIEMRERDVSNGDAFGEFGMSRMVVFRQSW